MTYGLYAASEQTFDVRQKKKLIINILQDRPKNCLPTKYQEAYHVLYSTNVEKERILLFTWCL